MRRLLALVTVAMFAAAPAHALGKGASLFSIQLSNGTADLVEPEAGNGFISAYDHSELGAQVEFWHLLSDDYAFTASGGIGFFSETDEPGTNAPAAAPEAKYTQSSFSLRVGGDRVVKIGDRAIVYFGPGLQFWSGKAKFEGFAPTDVESETVTRISLSSRIGANMMIGPNWGVGCHLGRLIGRASAEDAGAKASWWPSSLDAAGGIVFQFGGD